MVWASALNDQLGHVPSVLILEGTWWRETATASRLRHLTGIRELSFPDMFVGDHEGTRIAYCCAYGAARAVEPAHVFAQLGTPLVIQIGTCGVVAPGIEVGAVAVPRQAKAADGVSQHYGAGPQVNFDPRWADRAEDALTGLGVATLDTAHLTWPSLFAQSDAMCAKWATQGIQTIDMEASAVGAVAARFGRACIALLTTWDLLDNGKTFLDPLSTDAAAALARANEATFLTALTLAREVSEAAA